MMNIPMFEELIIRLQHGKEILKTNIFSLLVPLGGIECDMGLDIREFNVLFLDVLKTEGASIFTGQICKPFKTKPK